MQRGVASMGAGDFLEWLRSIERKWQRRWRESRIFEAEPDPERPKYFITVPYPYSNGPLHIGHGRTYTLGDIIARYKRLRGYNVLFPMAFHITGTPIVAISERIARGEEEVVERYRYYVSLYVDEGVEEIVKSFTDPYKLASFFAEKIQSDFEALGYSIDWRRRFHTGEPIYNAFVTWQFLKLHEKGLITQGEHYVTYCLLHKQPEGEDDIEDADVNPVEIMEYTAIKFRLEGSDKTYLVASTLRPETLFGATNLWVNPEAEYVYIEWRGEELVISSDALVKLQHQHPGEDIRVVKHVPGRELVGKWVISPLGDRLIVLPARFVDPDNATGIVYSEPSDAPYDYVALMELKRNPGELEKYGVDPGVLTEIEPRKIISVEGVEGHHAAKIVEDMGITRQDDPRLAEATRIVYKEQYYKGVMIVEHPRIKGLPVRDAKEAVRAMLLESGDAFIFYELNRKARCRAGGKIIVAKITNQWFINYNVPWWKERVRKHLLENMRIIPEKYLKAFLNTIDWLERRPCARKRGLGTRLPFDPEWIIESLSDSTIYMAFYTIAHIIRSKGIKAEQLKPELFDYVFLGKGDAGEVSEATGVPVEVLEEMRRSFTYWYPVDHRHTGIPHISNHLSFYIFHHVAIFPEQYWPRIISLNEMVIREGAKMSKSKGNVILLRDIASKYSADFYRLFIAGAANLDSVVDWREEDVGMVRESLRRFVNIVSRSIELGKRLESPETITDKWFLSVFQRIIENSTKAIEELRIRDYIQEAFYRVLALIDRAREREGVEKTYMYVYTVLREWLVLLSPVIPHVVEELWEKAGFEGMASAARWPEPRRELIDEAVEVLQEAVDTLIEDIRNVLNIIRPPPTKAYIIVAAPWKYVAARMVREGKSIRDIIEHLRREHGMSGREKEIVRFINEVRQAPIKGVERVSPEDELETLRELANYIARKTGLDVTVMTEEEAVIEKIPKVDKAKPLRPGFYLS